MRPYHCKSLLAFAIRTFAFAWFCLTWVTPCRADSVIYSNSFSGVAGPEWSTTVVSERGGERFLGEFNNAYIRFSITNIPPHSTITISFDLLILDTWDGSSGGD